MALHDSIPQCSTVIWILSARWVGFQTSEVHGLEVIMPFPGFQISIRLKLLLTGTVLGNLEQLLEFPDEERAVTAVLPVMAFAF